MTPRERLCRNMRLQQIPGLDGIRAVAAITVVACHSGHPFFPAGYAVYMFFILSGLLITTILLNENERTGAVDVGRFYVRRAFRLLPPLAVLIGCLAVLPWPTAPAAGLVGAALYCVNYLNAIGISVGIMGHTWSLAVEEHFYFIWPLIFRGNPSRVLRIAIVAAIVSAALRGIEWYWITPLYAFSATESNLSGIATGCALAIVIRRYPERIPNFALDQRLVLPSVAAVFALNIAGDSPWPVMISIAPLSVILLQAITFEWRVLENRIARFLGRLSYSIYLWHLVALAIVLELHIRPVTVWACAASVVIAALSYYVVERPAQAFGRRLTMR